MMLEALGQAALRTLLLIATIQLGLWLFRIKNPQLLLIVWTVVLASSLAMPVLQWVTPLRLTNNLDIPRIALEIPSVALVGETAIEWQPLVAQKRESLTSDAGIDWRPKLTRLLGVLYLLVAGLLLLRLAVGAALALRLLSNAKPISLNWATDARVRISRHVAAPVTIAKVILLPVDAVNWPATMGRAVIAHEHAHVARWDFAMLLLSQANRAVFWFSPLSWWLHGRLIMLAEIVSDDYAMEVTGDRSGYAEVLLEMGRRLGPVLRGVAMARPATLHYRIERILSENVRSNSVNPTQQMILAIGAVGLSVAIASSEINSDPLPNVTAMIEQQNAPTPPDAMFFRSQQGSEDGSKSMPLPQPPIALASEAPLHTAPLTLSGLPSAISRSHPNIRIVARPQPNPMVKSLITTQPPRVLHLSNSSTNRIEMVEASREIKPIASEGTLSHISARPDPTDVDDGDDDADEQRRAARPRPVAYSLENDRPVLRLINHQTCVGVFKPDHADTLAKDGPNLVPAILLRDASNATFLTLFTGGNTPLVQPVAVKVVRDKRTKIPSTVFTMLPTTERYLNGFIKRPYGRIDFDCGKSEAHSFDGGG